MIACQGIPLSLYVHLPWCRHKCPYCDFNSHARSGEVPEAQYLDALLADLDQDLEQFSGLIQGRSLVSVFIGGGTPSLFSPDAIGRLLEQVGARLNGLDSAEITLEANPGTLESGPLAGYRQAGVNRLSLGVQSFQDDLLQAIGRIHSADQARRAVDEARRAGFDNLNLDLMFALPGQAAAQSSQDLREAIGLAPEHLSRYQLTLEPNTLFHARPPELPDGELAWRMQTEGDALLEAAGYTRYEVSALARPGAHCRHNLNYWQFGDYLGIGAGAHGKLSGPDRVTRTIKQKHPTAYQAGGSPLLQTRTVEGEELTFEFLLNAFRLEQGFCAADFRDRTGQVLDTDHPAWRLALDREMVAMDQDRVWPTALGFRFLDDLQGLFLPDPPAAERAR
ncbi:MAG: radical SAM family heme chaperone HemW [Xanthomonadales bacterium]|nr:radical SAM family heme chaperone HemW [Xanthomonadales bacterium]